MGAAAHPPARPARKLGLIGATALVMGNMIGSGVFLLPASLAPFGWNGVLGWLVTIAGTLVLAWVLSQLTRARPMAENPAGFVTEAFGELPAFLVSWIYWVSIWTAIGSVAIAAVSYLTSLVPGLGRMPMGSVLLATALIWGATLINLRGVHTAGRFQVATVLLKVLPLVAIVVVAAVALATGTGEVRPFVPGEFGVSGLGGAAALTLFALMGFECASVAAANVEDPRRTVPRATMLGTALTGLIYLLVCSAVALMLPEAVAAGSPAPLATFVERYWSAGPAAFISVFAIVSCVGALNGWVMVQSEMPRDMAARGMLPSWFAATNARGTPVRSLVVSGAIATACLLLNASRSMQGIFEFIVLLATSAALWLYLAYVLAAWKLGVSRPLAVVGAGYALWTLWGAGVEASGWSLVLMVAGLPLWWLARREVRP